MKNIIIIGVLALTGSLIYAFSAPHSTDSEVAGEGIKWYSWEEAMEANKENPKKMFIDVYTDWCGWCKKMDKTTFKDPEVMKYLAENFYPIKFDAEQKEDIVYDGHILKFVASGRRGYHELAYSLLNGRMGYPAFVYLDETGARITISPGYKDAKGILKELKFIGGEHYKTTKFEHFDDSAGK